jgi:NAD(P)-dependent dehydrogenase (short-subunit alcohol dehydrogenase family)
MEITLEGKVALVTGASRGIGRAIAGAYAAAGANVLLSSRKLDALEAAAAEIREAGATGEVEPFAAHAGDPDQIAACVARCVERFGSLDILVNNAATNPYMGPNIDIDLPRFDRPSR